MAQIVCNQKYKSEVRLGKGKQERIWLWNELHYFQTCLHVALYPNENDSYGHANWFPCFLAHLILLEWLNAWEDINFCMLQEYFKRKLPVCSKMMPNVILFYAQFLVQAPVSSFVKRG